MLGQLPLLCELEITRMNTVKCISASCYSDHRNFNTNGSSNSPTVLFPELMTFRLTNMPNLEEWAEAATVTATTAVFPRLAALTIHDCPKLTNAPIHFPALEKLSIKYCPKMATGPSHFPCMKELEIEEMGNGSPLENIGSLTTLTTLRIERMTMITSLPDGLLHNNKNLTELKIWECPKLRYVVNNIQSSYYNSLRFLVIHNCENLRELPDVIPTLMSLEDFSIDNCPSLVSIPSMQSLASLRHMSLVCCGGLTCLPVTLLDSCTSLRSLVISDCHNLVSLPALQSCISLSYFAIFDCNKLNSLPEGLYHLTHLETLKIGGFSPELDSFPSLDGIHHLQLSLRKVYLIGWPHCHSIPEQLQHLTGLKCLTLSGFGMEALPELLGVFSSLGKLFLRGCENHKYFPTLESMQRHIKLETVQLFACDSLPGPDYSKISNFNPTILYKDYPHILRAKDIPEP